MYPATLLPDISHLKKVGVEPCFSNAIAEGWLMHPGSAGGYNHAVKVMLANISFYLLLAGVGTSIFVSDRDYDSGKLFRRFSHLLTINRTCYIEPALTDKNTYPELLLCQLTYLLWQQRLSSEIAYILNLNLAYIIIFCVLLGTLEMYLAFGTGSNQYISSGSSRLG